MKHLTVSLLAAFSFFTCGKNSGDKMAGPDQTISLESVRIGSDGKSFVLGKSGKTFNPWGFNYDHDRDGRLLEDYWVTEWEKVAEDFREMKALGANTVRIHLQTGKFLISPDSANPEALKKLGGLIELADSVGLYLNLTGLGLYHKADVPTWFTALSEAERWRTQGLFWESIAKLVAGHPAVFCYDLMNEPVLPGEGVTETDWVAGEFGGKNFVQRLTLDLAGRTQKEVARAWVDSMAAAIRKHDSKTLITVGVIPWAHVFPGAKPLFYSPEVGVQLDFASVHFYPKSGEIDKALTALAVYNVGKPMVVEEMFSLHCTLPELKEFIEASSAFTAGYYGFYWGKTPEELSAPGATIGDAIMKGFLEYFRKAPFAEKTISP